MAFIDDMQERDLALLRRLLKNPLHIVYEPHTQHLIGLIQHQ